MPTTLSSAAGMGLIIDHLANRLSATNPLSEKALIDYLDESSCAWEPCILASSKWSIPYQNYLVLMLHDFKRYLSVSVSLPS